jgi:hypothetical protein
VGEREEVAVSRMRLAELAAATEAYRDALDLVVYGEPGRVAAVVHRYLAARRAVDDDPFLREVQEDPFS